MHLTTICRDSLTIRDIGVLGTLEPFVQDSSTHDAPPITKNATAAISKIVPVRVIVRQITLTLMQILTCIGR